jgi:hypothetical protein
MIPAALQEKLALLLVAIAFLSLAWSFFRRTIAPAFSKTLLKRGQVKWAMRLHKRSVPSSGCGSCGPANKCH